MSSSTPPHNGRPVVVGFFDREKQAQQAIQGVIGLGVDRRLVNVFSPGQDAPPTTDLGRALAVAASEGADISSVLVSLGVPEGEARFYADEMRAGRSLVAVEAGQASDAVRELIVRHGGYDVQSLGRELARGEYDAGVPGGSGPPPIDLTSNWADVVSRYEMLWQQHYGTTDATWDEMAPVYEFAWRAANDARYRGRPWTEVMDAVRQQWQAAAAESALADRPWPEVAGPMRDVWEDVAEEAITGAEGGADRRIARQGTDQTVAARDVARDRPDHRRA